MLTYDEFKESFCARFPEVMGPEYEDYEMKLMPVTKRGKVLDGFTFCPKRRNRKETSVMPTFYFDDIYEMYREDPDINRHLYEVAASMRRAYAQGQSMIPNVSLDSVKKNIIAELVNPEVARSYICDIPHRYFLNLCIIYRWVVNVDDSGIYSTVIDNELMSAAGLNEEDLYANALKNTRKIIVPQIKSFDSIVRNIMKREGKTDSEIRKMLGKVDKENRIYVLTNKRNFRASTAIIYKEVLQMIAKKTESDYYIVPSSVNESLLVPVKAGLCPENLIEMLNESNSIYFNDDDQMLSDTVYYYNIENDSLDVFGQTAVSV
jgi:hypothetical protein